MAKKTQLQEIKERITESGISNLDGLNASKTTKYLLESGLWSKFGMTAIDGYVEFFNAGFRTTYKRNGRSLEQVQLMGTKPLSEYIYGQ